MIQKQKNNDKKIQQVTNNLQTKRLTDRRLFLFIFVVKIVYTKAAVESHYTMLTV